MLKRLFSKRSGFTLVEIIIAFVVFALFATMIMQILNMVSYERRSNAQFSDKIDEQELALLTKTKKEFDGSTVDGKLELDFGTYGKVETDYQMYGKFVGDSSDGLEVDGLAYFQGDEIVSAMPPVEENPGGDDSDKDSDGDGGSQMNRVNTRIAGSRGLDYVAVNNVVKYEGKIKSSETKWVCKLCGKEYNNQWDGWEQCLAQPGGWYPCNGHLEEREVVHESEESYLIYAFDLSAQIGADMNRSDIPFGNYRLYFYDKHGNPCEIAFANYLNTDSINTPDLIASAPRAPISKDTAITSGGNSPSDKNRYTVSITGTNSIRVGSPFSESGVPFEGGNHTRIEVAFKNDPELTTSSFGENAIAQSDGSCQYKPNANVGGVDVGPNIYGAFPK